MAPAFRRPLIRPATPRFRTRAALPDPRARPILGPVMRAIPCRSSLPLRPSRREFLRSGALAAAAIATASMIPRATAQVSSPVQVGFMGLNRRGLELLREFLDTRRVVVTWLCDVDRRALENATAVVRERQARPVRAASDLRQMLDDRRLQAVVIAAPDHWHAPAALLAARAGKHAFVETPLSHNPREAEWIVDAFRRSRTVLQTGLQRRSLDWVRRAIELVRGGGIGPVHFARAWYADRRGSMGYGQLAPVPEWLDYTLWQGPAPERPFRDNIVHDHWRWIWHWGTGELGQSGIHFLDLARWGLNVQCPQRVASTGGRYFFDDDQETPDTQVATFDFGDRVISWEHRSCQPYGSEDSPAGVAFHGRTGTLILGETGFRVLDLDGRETAREDGEVKTAPHVAQFLDCIERPSNTPTAPAEDGRYSTLLCHLGNIAHRTGEKIELNPATAQPRGSRAAAALWSREYRPGWEPRP